MTTPNQEPDMPEGDRICDDCDRIDDDEHPRPVCDAPEAEYAIADLTYDGDQEVRF